VRDDIVDVVCEALGIPRIDLVNLQDPVVSEAEAPCWRRRAANSNAARRPASRRAGLGLPPPFAQEEGPNEAT